MPLDMVLRYWPYVEADFARYYQCHHPLTLSWRRFMVYFRGLPLTSTFAIVSGDERKMDSMSATERMAHYRSKQEANITGAALEALANE